ncbi:hypothetical protein DFH06DRAFT_1343502 [Mycena polygramma]|nr:hypothetical protein DFH06DRAFT_1343502 [Mycena polygramma]
MRCAAPTGKNASDEGYSDIAGGKQLITVRRVSGIPTPLCECASEDWAAPGAFFLGAFCAIAEILELDYARVDPAAPVPLRPHRVWCTVHPERVTQSRVRPPASEIIEMEYRFLHSILCAARPQIWILAAMHLSFRPFQVKALTCFFGSGCIARDLRLWGDMIPRCAALQVLDMHFHEDLLRCPVYPSPLSRQELTCILCSIIASMASRVTGPVVILSADDNSAQIYSCMPTDVLGWGLYAAQFNLTKARKLRSRARHILRLREEEIPKSSFNRSAHIRLHTGKKLKYGVQAPSVLLSVHLMSIPSYSPWRSSTLLVFNTQLITRLALKSRYLDGQEGVPADYLNPVIDRVRLPCLREFELDDDSMHPTALGWFLFNHPTIEQIEYRGRSDELLPRPAVDPPLVHPSLISLDMNFDGKASTDSTGRLLPALIHSPNLRIVCFSMTVWQSRMADLWKSNHSYINVCTVNTRPQRQMIILLLLTLIVRASVVQRPDPVPSSSQNSNYVTFVVRTRRAKPLVFADSLGV